MPPSSLLYSTTLPSFTWKKYIATILAKISIPKFIFSLFQNFICKERQCKNISSANILEKNKQTNNQTKHTIKNLMIFFCVCVCVCIKDMLAIRIVSTHPRLQYTLRVVLILLGYPKVLTESAILEIGRF